jgi:hypothetical protein
MLFGSRPTRKHKAIKHVAHGNEERISAWQRHAGIAQRNHVLTSTRTSWETESRIIVVIKPGKQRHVTIPAIPHEAFPFPFPILILIICI